MSTKRCLICYKEVLSRSGTDDNNDAASYSPQISLSVSSTEVMKGDRNRCNVLDKNIYIMFILTKLLELPSSLSTTYFEKSQGQNPCSWINLCEKCDDVVMGARNIFEEIVNASRKFKNVQEDVVRKIRESAQQFAPSSGLDENGAPMGKTSGNGQELDPNQFVTMESREFVRKYEYLFTNPFLLGDLEADMILDRLENVQVKQESCDVLEIEGGFGGSDDDPEWEPEHNEKRAVKRPVPKKRRARKTPNDNLVKLKSRIEKQLAQEGAFLEADGNVLFKCQVETCGKILKHKHSYETHKLQHSQSPLGGEIFCSECGGAFASVHGLNRHLKAVHHKIQEEIEVLSEQQKRDRLKRAVKVKCPHCDLQINRFKLKYHIDNKHNKAYKYNCELCGKCERGRWELKHHQASIHFICSMEKCKLTCGNWEELRSHQLAVHGKEVNVFACDECGKLFVKRSWLREHKKMHIHEKKRTEEEGADGDGGQFICDLCGKRFVLQSYLNYHIWHTHKKLRKKSKRGEN